MYVCMADLPSKHMVMCVNVQNALDDAIRIPDKIVFDVYTGLPHVAVLDTIHNILFRISIASLCFRSTVSFNLH